MVRDQLSKLIDNVITGVLIIVLFLTPLIFLPLTTEFFEIPKVTLIAFSSLLLLVLWSLSWVLNGKVTITRTPLDIPLLLLLAAIVVSAVLSDSRPAAIIGNLPRVHGSAISWVSYIIFYFVAASHLKSAFQVRVIYYALLISASLNAIISLFSYFGIYLINLPFAKTINFTLAGSSFSTTSLLALLLPFLLLSVIKTKEIGTRSIPFYLFLALLTLFGVTIALTGDLASIGLAISALFLSLFISKRSELEKTLLFIGIPVLISLLIFGLSALPIGDNANPLKRKAEAFPRELQLGFSTSWKVAASTFRDHPFLGTGPGTFLFNFTQYRPIEHNNSKFWNVRFDTAFNEFLQTLSTLGGLGLIALVFLTFMIFTFGWKGLAEHDNTQVQALSISAVLICLALAFHPTTPVFLVAAFGLLAMLMVTHKRFTGKVEELSIGIKASRLTDSNLIVGDILPIIIFIPLFILSVIASWKGVSLVAADYYHRLALNSAQTKALDTYNYLVKAEQLNDWSDLYRIDLAQTNFALANSIAVSKAPTEASPTGSLTDQDKQNIQTLLSQSINEGRAATAISPRNPHNWEVLASIYRQISGVAQNALQFSLDAYGRAIQRDPLNPSLRLAVGGVYYSVKDYDSAIRFFSEAAQLKPDFANAYYNLSVALRDKGDLRNAQAVAEKVMSLLDPKAADYQTAADYLTDLKARIATGSAKESQITAPAAAQNAPLQQKNLPSVDIDSLKNKPENIASPPAVKR